MSDQTTTKDSSIDGGASALTGGLERMFRVTEFDHPDHGWTWRECELRYINDRIRTAMSAEREACAIACEETGNQPSSLWEEPGCWTQASETCAFSIRMRSNALGNRRAAFGASELTDGLAGKT